MWGGGGQDGALAPLEKQQKLVIEQHNIIVIINIIVCETNILCTFDHSLCFCSN